MNSCPQCAQSSVGECPRHHLALTPLHSAPFAPVILPPRRRPFCCPVCGGRGQVAAGFYDAWPPVGQNGRPGTNPEACRTCEGSGVLWG